MHNKPFVKLRVYESLLYVVDRGILHRSWGGIWSLIPQGLGYSTGEGRWEYHAQPWSFSVYHQRFQVLLRGPHDSGISFPAVARQGRNLQFFRLSRTSVRRENPHSFEEELWQGAGPGTTFAAVATSQPFNHRSAPRIMPKAEALNTKVQCWKRGLDAVPSRAQN